MKLKTRNIYVGSFMSLCIAAILQGQTPKDPTNVNWSDLRRWTRFHVLLPAATDQQKQCGPADASLVFSCAGNKRQIQL